MTQKEVILLHLKEIGDWVREYSLRSINTNFGWIGNQGDRRCRELFNEGRLERRVNGKYAEYKISSKMPCVDKLVEKGQSIVNESIGLNTPIPALNSMQNSEIKELQLTAQSLLKNIKIGDKRFIEANIQYKALKNARTDKDKVRILNNIIYLLNS